MKVKTLLRAAACCGLMALAPAVSAQTYSADNPLKVALVVHGNLGDKSFFDSAAAGMKTAVETLPVTVKIIEANSQRDRWQPAFEDAAASGYDVVIVGTFEMTGFLTEYAKDYPETKFILFDDAPDFSTGCCENVLGIRYRTASAAYLAGFAAAKVSKTGVLGEVLGMEFKTVTDFANGFEQGAKAARPDVRFLRAVTNSFADPAKGKEVALAQIAQGADVIFPIAGATGIGALQAARDNATLAVGVDSDQAGIFAPTDPAQADIIMTSVVKNIGASLVDALRDTIDGKARYGGGMTLGLAEGAVGITKNAQYDRIVPAEVRAKIDTLSAKIISGEIKVESSLD